MSKGDSMKSFSHTVVFFLAIVGVAFLASSCVTGSSGMQQSTSEGSAGGSVQSPASSQSKPGTIDVGRTKYADKFGVKVQDILGVGNQSGDPAALSGAVISLTSKDNIKLDTELDAKNGNQLDSVGYDWSGTSGKVFTAFPSTGTFKLIIYANLKSDTSNNVDEILELDFPAKVPQGVTTYLFRTATSHGVVSLKDTTNGQKNWNVGRGRSIVQAKTAVLADDLNVSVGGTVLHSKGGSKVTVGIYKSEIIGLQFSPSEPQSLTVAGIPMSVDPQSTVYVDATDESFTIAQPVSATSSAGIVLCPPKSKLYFSLGKLDMVRLSGEGKVTVASNDFPASGIVYLDHSDSGDRIAFTVDASEQANVANTSITVPAGEQFTFQSGHLQQIYFPKTASVAISGKYKTIQAGYVLKFSPDGSYHISGGT